MATPDTRAGLEANRYIFLNRAKCKGCGRTIEWWRKVPGPVIPFEEPIEAPGKMVNHFVTCPKREAFKKAPSKEVVQKREERLSKKQAKERQRKENERLKEEAKGGKLFE